MSKIFQYSIVRYVPDVVRDEAVNVGVLVRAAEGERFEFKFLPRSATVRKLWPGADQALVRNFERQLTSCAENDEPLGRSGRIVDSEFFDKARSEFNGNLQLSLPRAATGESIDQVLKRAYQTSVAEPGVGTRPINYQMIAPYRLRQRLWNAFQKRDLLRPGRVRKEIVLKGKHAPWTFDLGYQNGAIHVVNSLALNAPTPEANLGRALVLKGMLEEVRTTQNSSIKGIAVVEGLGNKRSPKGAQEAGEILTDAKIATYAFSDLDNLIAKVERDLS